MTGQTTARLPVPQTVRVLRVAQAGVRDDTGPHGPSWWQAWRHAHRGTADLQRRSRRRPSSFGLSPLIVLRPRLTKGPTTNAHDRHDQIHHR
jgi:hypothetical protein